MEYTFLFYLEDIKSRVEVIAKNLEAAAAKCYSLYGTFNIALSAVTPIEK